MTIADRRGSLGRVKVAVHMVMLSLVFSAVAGCATSTSPSAGSPTVADTQSSLSVGELATDARARSGERVAVTGFLRFGDDAHNLWHDRQSWEHVERNAVPPNDPAWNRCITLFGYGSFRDVLLQRDQTVVTIRGRVRVVQAQPEEIMLGSCSTAGVEVEAVR